MLKRSIGVATVAVAFVATGSLASGAGAYEVDDFGRAVPANSSSSGSTAAKSAQTDAAKPTTAGAPGGGRPMVCDGVLDLGDSPKTKLVVPDGASCTVVDSTIKSLRARPGAVDVRVIDTEVTRNLMVRGATGTVHIGPEGCRYDPIVGNNIVVRNSHHVLICFTSVDNNIMVRGNDGRITVRDSSAGNNLRVSRNLAYAPQAGDPATLKAAAIRLLRNTADNHIVARDNAASRDIIDRSNSPMAIIA